MAWARSSKESKRVRKLEADFVATVKATKKIALVKKEKLKLEKALKTIKQLEMCKKHGGPITPNCVDILDSLDIEKLLAEISYLRLTTVPNVRQMKRVKVDGKYKMQKFSEEELRTSIRNVVKPQDDVNEDVETLLQYVL